MSNLSSLITQTIGSSAGGVNLITAPSSSSIWTGTGGVTVSTTTTAAELPLEGFSSTAVKFSLSASSGTAYCDFDCPTALQNFLLQLLWYSRASSAFTAAITLSINSYSSSSNRTSNTSPTVVTPQVSAIIGAGINFETNFLSTSNQYLRLTLSFGAQASAWYSIAQFSIGPSNRTQGPANGEYQFTTTGIVSSGGGAVTAGTGGQASDILRWRRLGSSIEMLFAFNWGTTGTAFGTGAAYRFPLPNGLNMVTTGTGSQALGIGRLYDSSAGTFYDVVATWAGTGSTYLVLSPLDGANIDIGPTSPFTFAVNDIMTMFVTVPVAEWQGSALNLGQGAQVEYAYNNSGATTGFNNAAFAYGPIGAPIGSITANTRFGVKFQYPVQDGDEISLEIWEGIAGSPWKQVGSTMRGGVDINFHYQNGTDYGMGISTDRTAPSDVTVTFGQYAYNTSTFGVAGTSWATAGLNTAYWRVKKSRPSAPVGFGLANVDGSAGLYKAGSAPGVATTVSSFNSTGNVGEVKTMIRTTGTSFPATGVWGDGSGEGGSPTSLSLPAGIWDVTATGSLNIASATFTAGQEWDIGFSTTTGNSASGLSLGVNRTSIVFQSSTAANAYGTQSCRTVLRSDGTNLYLPNGTSMSGTTLYWKIFVQYGSTAPIYVGQLTAIRIA